jgi:hypothetical protein
MASNNTSEYKLVADKIISPDEDIIFRVEGSLYMNSITDDNRIATISDIGDGNGVPQSLGSSASPTFVKVITTSNGAGTNVKIGDDAWIGDLNIANHIGVVGFQDATNGGVIFGNAKTEIISSNGEDLSLEADNDIVLAPGSGNAYLGSVTDNNKIATMASIPTDSGWIVVSSFSNNFAGTNVAYRKINNVVYLRGNVSGGTAASAAFTLPTGFRPATIDHVCPTQQFGTINITYTTVATNGTVIPTASSTWLSGISYPV